MKEIMGQYGQCLVTVIIALLLFLIIAGPSAGGTKNIYTAVGKTIEQQVQEPGAAETLEFERYWRLR